MADDDDDDYDGYGDDDDEYGDNDDGDDDIFPANVAAVLLPYWQSMLDRDGERCDLSEYLI